MLDSRQTGENTMRAFTVACLVIGVIAVGTAAILDNFVQEPSSAAFAEPSARI
jgi:cobalamin synthase